MLSGGHDFGGDWTRKKLKILQKYLEAYRKIFTANKKARKLTSWYLDAFAGAGIWKPRDESGGGTAEDKLFDPVTASFFQGSPLVALELSSPFDSYLFIEQDEESAALLRRRCEEKCPAKLKSRVNIEVGDSNVVLQKFAAHLEREPMDRAVVFLDPFGLSVKWETVEILAKTQKVDMWYWFNIGAVHRLLPRAGEPNEPLAKKLTMIFGTENWKDAFYAQARDLFQWDCSSKIVNTNQIADYLISRLKIIFGDNGVCPEYGLFRNSKSAPLFLFLFAASNPKGKGPAVRIARDILIKECYES